MLLFFFVEVFSLVVLGLFVALEKEPRACLRDAALIAAGAFLGEDTCIRVYGFYSYAPGWHAFVDKVPVVVLLIWPAVVLSATKIARALLPATTKKPTAVALGLTAGAVVTFDAALIEPIAVHSELWSWTEPGLFRVPLIGVLGWGFYAGCMVFLLERLRGAARWGAPVLAALGTHGVLLGAWWGLFRWVLRSELAAPQRLGAAGLAALVYLFVVLRTEATLARRDLLARAVATSLFVFLLARAPDLSLVSYAALFTLPHLTLVAASLRRRPS